LRLTKDDVFDDLGKLIKPLHPATFNVLSAADFRKALTSIIQDRDKPISQPPLVSRVRE
jgi:hypothetical protein